MAYQDSSLMTPKQDCSLPVQRLFINFCTQEQRLKERKCIIDPHRSLEELKLKSESRLCEATNLCCVIPFRSISAFHSFLRHTLKRKFGGSLLRAWRRIFCNSDLTS